MSNLTALSFDLEATLGLAKSNSKAGFLQVPKNGHLVFKILPALPGTKAIAAKHVLHWGFQNESGNKVPLKCSYHGPERFCPICEHVFALKKELKQYVDEEGNRIGGTDERIKTIKDTLDAIGARTAYFLNVVEKEEGLIKVLQVPSTVFDDLVIKIEEAVNKYQFDPLALEKGVWFKVTRTGEKFNTKYTVDYNKIMKKTADGEDAEVRDSAPLSEEVLKAVKSQLSGSEGQMRNLNDLYEPKTAKELQAVLDGAPVSSKKQKPTTQAANKYLGEESTGSSDFHEESSSNDAPPVQNTGSGSHVDPGIRSEIEEMRRKAKASRGMV